MEFPCTTEAWLCRGLGGDPASATTGDLFVVSVTRKPTEARGGGEKEGPRQLESAACCLPRLPRHTKRGTLHDRPRDCWPHSRTQRCGAEQPSSHWKSKRTLECSRLMYTLLRVEFVAAGSVCGGKGSKSCTTPNKGWEWERARAVREYFPYTQKAVAHRSKSSKKRQVLLGLAGGWLVSKEG